MKQPTITNPGGTVYALFSDMLRQSHLLIAGASGSGKSVLLNGLICAVLLHHPNDKQLILIDPKRTELNEYADMPHTLAHATEPPEIPAALSSALNIIERRYRAMQKAGERTYTGPDLYIIIDELADLMTTQRKQVVPLIQRICQIGRAARVHLIAATQCPLAKIIPTEIKVNFTAIAGLHTLSRQHSRNIIDKPGCEALPLYGSCIYVTPQRGPELYAIPYTSPGMIRQLVEFYAAQQPPTPPRRKWWQKLTSWQPGKKNYYIHMGSPAKGQEGRK